MVGNNFLFGRFVTKPVATHLVAERALNRDNIRVTLQKLFLVKLGRVNRRPQNDARCLVKRLGIGRQIVLLRAEQLVDVEYLLVVATKVQVLLVPVVRVNVEVGLVQEHHDLVRGHGLVARGIC